MFYHVCGVCELMLYVSQQTHAWANIFHWTSGLYNILRPPPLGFPNEFQGIGMNIHPRASILTTNQCRA